MSQDEKDTTEEESHPQGDLPPADKVEQNESPTENLTKAQKKANEWETKFAEVNDKYIRLYSEFDNYKKRNAKERIEFARAA